MLSGSTLDSWALTRNPLKFAKSVASSLKLNTKNYAKMVEDLQKISPEKIQKATSSVYKKVSSMRLISFNDNVSFSIQRVHGMTNAVREILKQIIQILTKNSHFFSTFVIIKNYWKVFW